MQTGIVQTLPLPFALSPIFEKVLDIPEKVVPLHTECGEICLLATTLKNAKIFHIVFLVSLHVFRIRWSFFVFACRAEMRRLK